MSLQGKETRSYRKVDFREQQGQVIGFKRLVFAHKASAGDTGINFSSLNTPSEMSVNGFVNASYASLTGAHLEIYKNNLILISSLRGILMLDLSYTVRNNRIIFVDFTAEENEIFTGVFEQSKAGQIALSDARPLSVSGTLPAGSTLFSVGEAFSYLENPLSQSGAVLVFRNGLQQFRCVGNSLLNEGNYIEVSSGSLCSQIQFKNSSGSDDSILVVSNGSLVERPQESTMQYLEAVSGKVDSLIPTVAALAGVSESNFGGVTNVDLKAFSDLVNSILNAQVPVVTEWANYIPTITTVSGTMTNATPSGKWRRIGDTMEIQGRIAFSGAVGTFSDVRLSLPSGYSIETNKIVSPSGAENTFGVGSSDGATPNYTVLVKYASTTTVVFYKVITNSGTNPVSTNWAAISQADLTGGNAIDVMFKVPITGWTSTQSLRQQLGI